METITLSRLCRSCGVDISDRPAKHFMCVRCYATAARELRTGKEKLSPTCSGVGFTPARVDQLIRLLDQPNKREAREVATWLQTAKQVLIGERADG